MSREFFILRIESDGHLVFGRCDQEIKVGDVFVKARTYSTLYYLEDYSQKPILEKEWPVHLTVEGIDIYNNKLEKLLPHMSGRLSLDQSFTSDNVFCSLLIEN